MWFNAKTVSANDYDELLLDEGSIVHIDLPITYREKRIVTNVGDLSITAASSTVSARWQPCQGIELTDRFIEISMEVALDILVSAANKNGGSLTIEEMQNAINRHLFLQKLKKYNDTI